MRKLQRLSAFLAALSLMALSGLSLLGNQVSAAQITARSLTLQDGSGTNYATKVSATVNDKFDFKLATSGTIHSISFQYCKTADGTCVEPTGMDTTGATLGTQTGLTFDSLDATTDGTPYVTSSAGVSVTGGTTVYDVILQGVQNPDATDCPGTIDACTFYVRITSYTSTDATTGAVDAGNVAASTTQGIDLSGIMPESLVFCTGHTITTTSGVPDCTTADSGSIQFNQDFSPIATATATSQMAASTNAGSGYSITVEGPDLTSGGNHITDMSAATTSQLGHSQFGMNLMVNTTPAVGTAVAPAANGTNFRGEPKPASGYATANTFKYTSGDAIADSADGGAGGTDAQIFTSSYIVNVTGSQPAGTYTTTLTYICTPTF